jgi:hypothetical protein
LAFFKSWQMTSYVDCCRQVTYWRHAIFAFLIFGLSRYKTIFEQKEWKDNMFFRLRWYAVFVRRLVHTIMPIRWPAVPTDELTDFIVFPEWTDDLINNEEIFPPRDDIPFPKNFQDTCSKIFRWFYTKN